MSIDKRRFVVIDDPQYAPLQLTPEAQTRLREWYKIVLERAQSSDHVLIVSHIHLEDDNA
jgi:hypothetical protein